MYIVLFDYYNDDGGDDDECLYLLSLLIDFKKHSVLYIQYIYMTVTVPIVLEYKASLNVPQMHRHIKVVI